MSSNYMLTSVPTPGIMIHHIRMWVPHHVWLSGGYNSRHKSCDMTGRVSLKLRPCGRVELCVYIIVTVNSREVRVPNKDLVKLFIRAHALRSSGLVNCPWIVDENFVRKHSLPPVIYPSPQKVCVLLVVSLVISNNSSKLIGTTSISSHMICLVNESQKHRHTAY